MLESIPSSRLNRRTRSRILHQLCGLVRTNKNLYCCGGYKLLQIIIDLVAAMIPAIAYALWRAMRHTHNFRSSHWFPFATARHNIGKAMCLREVLNTSTLTV